MNNYFYLNPSRMLELTRKLPGSEIKMLYGMMYCMCYHNSRLFINNAENRKLLEEIDFKKSPERISLLLSSLTKKGITKREANAVYSLPDDLFIIPSKVKEIVP